MDKCAFLWITFAVRTIQTAAIKSFFTLKMKPQAVKVGDRVTIFVPDYASVYDYKGELVVCEFYAIEIDKGEK